MLQQGESLTCVQRQLGHASINLTADTYGEVGSHSEIKPLWTVCTLPWCLKVVADGVVEAEANAEVVGKFGGPCRGRTYGPLIKRCPVDQTQQTQEHVSEQKHKESE
jgi:hypothetical protein